jgi:REP element-mobilizing transposase RayT
MKAKKMLVIDVSEKLNALGPGAFHFAQVLNEKVECFCEKPGVLNYEAMREAQLQFNAAVYCETQDLDISRQTVTVMWRNWVEVDNEFNESFKKESPYTLPKTHNLYAETMTQKALTDRSYFEHSVHGKHIHKMTGNLIEREKSLIAAQEWYVCVLDLLKNNMYYLTR